MNSWEFIPLNKFDLVIWLELVSSEIFGIKNVSSDVLKYFPNPIQVIRIKKIVKSFLYFQIVRTFIFFTLNKDIREIINMSHTDIRDL